MSSRRRLFHLEGRRRMSRARRGPIQTPRQPIADRAADNPPPGAASDTLKLRIEQIAAVWSSGLIESTSTRAQHELAAAIDNTERALANVILVARRLEADADRFATGHAQVPAAAARVGALAQRWLDRCGLRKLLRHRLGSAPAST
jgi:hypothetical protein